LEEGEKMLNAVEVVAKPSFGKLYLAVSLVVALCITNYLALFNDGFRQLFLGTTTTEKVASSLRDSDKVQLAMMATMLGVSATDLASNVRDLADRHKKLGAEKELLSSELGNARKSHQELSVKHQALEQRYVDLDKAKLDLDTRTKSAAKRLSKNVATRTARGVTRHVAGAAGESIPVVGSALIAGMLALDVMDGCELLKEVNEMNRAVGADIEDEGKVCGVKVPTQSELAHAVTTNWKVAYQAASDAIGKPPTVPTVSWSDLKSQVCAVTAIPMVCP
jgi:hypothetical protein